MKLVFIIYIIPVLQNRPQNGRTEVVCQHKWAGRSSATELQQFNRLKLAHHRPSQQPDKWRRRGRRLDDDFGDSTRHAILPIFYPLLL